MAVGHDGVAVGHDAETSSLEGLMFSDNHLTRMS